MPIDLAERVRHTRLLIETVDDPYPTPRGALVSDSGPAASRYVPCETCRRSGWVRRRRGYALCLVCDGNGWKRRTHEDPEWDAYLELPLVEAAELPREQGHRVELDSNPQEAPYGWERLRQAYDRHGSYGELRRRLEWLSGAAPRRYRLIRVTLIEHQPVWLGEHDELERELGVVMVALRMRVVRVPAWLMEHAEASARRETISGLAAQGLRPAEIARRLGLSKKAVQRKLRPTGAIDFQHAGATERCA